MLIAIITFQTHLFRQINGGKALATQDAEIVLQEMATVTILTLPLTPFSVTNVTENFQIIISFKCICKCIALEQFHVLFVAIKDSSQMLMLLLMLKVDIVVVVEEEIMLGSKSMSLLLDRE